MIVVIGSPVLRRDARSSGPAAAGLPTQVALAAALADRNVQLVGKIGNDAAGDALIVALGHGRIRHAALLRDAAHATPVVNVSPPPADADLEDALIDDPADLRPTQIAPGLPLEAGDIELALRYLTDFRVVVIAAALDSLSMHATLDAASFAGAHVIRLDTPGSEAAEPPPDGVEVTAFEAPAHEEPAFAAMVARYATGLDMGRSPRDAFADATRSANWERSAPD